MKLCAPTLRGARAAGAERTCPVLKKQCLGTTLNNGVAVNNGPVNLDIGNGGVRARGPPLSQPVS